MMHVRALARLLGTAALAAALVMPAAAATFDDPDWPCVQRKVPEITLGQMWAGPVPEGTAPNAAEIEALAREIAPRRVDVAAAAEAAAAFVAGVEGEARGQQLAWLMQAVLDRINAERGAIIAGIGRYAHRQSELSEQVETEQLTLAELRGVPDDARDWDRIEELQDKLAWDTRVFKERAQSLIHVCETPVLLERRAFDLARALAALL